jgi:hypothetical protein
MSEYRTWEELEAELLRPRPLWHEARARWRRLWTPLPWMRLYYWSRTRWQRSRRGWADRDVWSMDTYLSGIAAEMTARLAATDHGWPDGRFATYEEWTAYLCNLAERLGAWRKGEASFVDESAYETTRMAMVELAEHLGDFWD